MTSKTYVCSKYDKYIIFCECGCGETFSEFNRWGHKRRFVNGHHMPDQKGSNNRNWKGGHLTHKGYRRIGRKLLEHRHIYEQYHKCCLMPYTDIHHKDGNKLNNDITNLEALTHSQHSLISWQKRKQIR